MRAKMKKADKPKDQQSDVSISEAKTEPQRTIRSEDQPKETNKNLKADATGTKGEDNEEKYSDIDTKFEEKLKNNQVEDTREDPFDEDANKSSHFTIYYKTHIIR